MRKKIKNTRTKNRRQRQKSCKFFHSQVLSASYSWSDVAGEGNMGRVGMKGHFQERVFVLEKQTGNIVSCLDGVGGGGVLFLLFHISLFVFLLTVARSCVLDFQQHPHRTSSLLHGTFAGICGVVAGAHRLVRPALRTGLVAERAATPAHPSVPQTLLPCTALDVLT